MVPEMLATDGLTLTPAWLLGTLGGAGTVIGVLFKLLISAKDQEIARLKAEHALFVEQVRKDEIRREKEDEHIDVLIETIRTKCRKC